MKRKLCEIFNKIFSDFERSDQFLDIRVKFSRPLWPFSWASAVHVPFSEASAVFYQLYCVSRWHQGQLKHKICEIFNMIFSDFERSDQFLDIRVKFSRPLWPFSWASAVHVPFSEASAVFNQLYWV